MNNEASRKVYIDFLKIIAIYMVIFNHCRLPAQTDTCAIFGGQPET